MTMPHNAPERTAEAPDENPSPAALAGMVLDQGQALTNLAQQVAALQKILMSAEAREVLGAALADAAAYREARASTTPCAECDGSPAGLCNQHEADFELSDAYLLLAAELGIEVQS